MASITKRGASFQVKWRETGGKQRSRTFATRKEAVAFTKRIDKTQHVLYGTGRVYADQQRGFQTLAAYSVLWLPSKPMESATRENWKKILTKHILPQFGNSALVNITQADIRSWFVFLRQKGISGPLQAKIRTVLVQLFEGAIADGKITVNPARGIRVSSVPVNLPVTITPSQYKRLLKYIPEKYRVLIRVLAEAGLRQGEAFELTSDDITGNSIKVLRVQVQLNAPLRFEVKHYTKNGGIRSVPVSQSLTGALLSLGDGPLFRKPNGERISRSFFHDNIWEPALKFAGLPKMHVHHLRATYATWSKLGGGDLLAIRDNLGHKNVATTNRYLYSLEESRTVAAKGVETMLM